MVINKKSQPSANGWDFFAKKTGFWFVRSKKLQRVIKNTIKDPHEYTEQVSDIIRSLDTRLLLCRKNKNYCTLIYF